MIYIPVKRSQTLTLIKSVIDPEVITTPSGKFVVNDLEQPLKSSQTPTAIKSVIDPEVITTLSEKLFALGSRD